MQGLFPTAFFVQQAVLRRRAFWCQIVHINKNEGKIAFSRKKQNFSLPLPICFSHIPFVFPPPYAIATTFPLFSFQATTTTTSLLFSFIPNTVAFLLFYLHRRLHHIFTVSLHRRHKHHYHISTIFPANAKLTGYIKGQKGLNKANKAQIRSN